MVILKSWKIYWWSQITWIGVWRNLLTDSSQIRCTMYIYSTYLSRPLSSSSKLSWDLTLHWGVGCLLLALERFLWWGGSSLSFSCAFVHPPSHIWLTLTSNDKPWLVLTPWMPNLSNSYLCMVSFKPDMHMGSTVDQVLPLWTKGCTLLAKCFIKHYMFYPYFVHCWQNMGRLMGS